MSLLNIFRCISSNVPANGAAGPQYRHILNCAASTLMPAANDGDDYETPSARAVKEAFDFLVQTHFLHIEPDGRVRRFLHHPCDFRHLPSSSSSSDPTTETSDNSSAAEKPRTSKKASRCRFGAECIFRFCRSDFCLDYIKCKHDHHDDRLTENGGGRTAEAAAAALATSSGSSCCDKNHVSKKVAVECAYGWYVVCSPEAIRLPFSGKRDLPAMDDMLRVLFPELDTCAECAVVAKATPCGVDSLRCWGDDGTTLCRRHHDVKAEYSPNQFSIHQLFFRLSKLCANSSSVSSSGDDATPPPGSVVVAQILASENHEMLLVNQQLRRVAEQQQQQRTAAAQMELRLKLDFSTLWQEREKTVAEHQSLIEKLKADLTSEAAEHRSRQSDLQQKIDRLKQEKATAEADAEAMRKEFADSNARSKEELEAADAKHNFALSQLRAEHDRVKAEVDRLRAQCSRLVDEMNSSKKIAEKKKKGKREEVSAVGVPTPATMMAELEKMRVERDAAVRKRDQVQTENAKLRAQIRELQSEKEQQQQQQQQQNAASKSSNIAPGGDVSLILQAKYQQLLSIVDRTLQRSVIPELRNHKMKKQLNNSVTYESVLITKANAAVLNSRFSLFNFSNLFKDESEQELNPRHFELAFHGTTAKNSKAIVQESGVFHPGQRGSGSSVHASQLAHDAGEYFAVATGKGYELAHKYSRDEAIVVALVVKVPGAYRYAHFGGVANGPHDIIVVRNPEAVDDQGSFCVPLCEILFRDRVLSESQRAPPMVAGAGRSASPPPLRASAQQQQQQQRVASSQGAAPPAASPPATAPFPAAAVLPRPVLSPHLPPPPSHIVVSSWLSLSQSWNRVEFQSDDGRWIHSDPALQSKILEYFQTHQWHLQLCSGSADFIISQVQTASAPQPYDYMIRFVTFQYGLAEQVNAATGKVRRIRFLV